MEETRPPAGPEPLGGSAPRGADTSSESPARPGPESIEGSAPRPSPEPLEGSAARPGPEEIRERIIAQLHTVYDPEIPVDIYELGLVYEVRVDEAGRAAIRMTLTSPMCPAAEMLPPEVETKARSVPGVSSVELELVWDPPWSPERMSEAAKLELGMV
jgi:FeS assembly SUF system protein